MANPVTVADLVARCTEHGVDPADVLVCVERNWPTPATDVDVTYLPGGGGHSLGLVLYIGQLSE